MPDASTELDITKPEEKAVFLEHLQSLYTSLIQDSPNLSREDRVKIESLFRDLQQDFQDLCQLSEKNTHISDDRIDNLQSLYNNFINLSGKFHEGEDKVGKRNKSVVTHDRLNEIDRKSKKMKIGVDEQSVQPIKIAVAEATEDRLRQKESSGRMENSSPFIPISVLNKQSGRPVSKSDPVRNVIHHKKFPVTIPDQVLEETSLTQQYLQEPRYKSFIANNYSSPKAFERILDSTITKIENETIDVFERWLQEERASVFPFIQDMTIDEVMQLSTDPEVRLILKENNLKYETFLHWVDQISIMQDVVNVEPVSFGDLYARWMIETEMST